jgi:ATPase subunit of ABC transporter with duplicated ATPase domains
VVPASAPWLNHPVLALDEPTNHLDLYSIEALEDVLAACPCALVLVSHDAPFLKAATGEQWQFSLDGFVCRTQEYYNILSVF